MKALVLLFLLPLSLMAQNKTIAFYQGSFEEAKTLANNKRKLIFVDVYTDWCGPCKVMDKTVFTNDTVADYFNEKFINYKLNAESERELASLYNVRAYPTFLIIDAKGKLLHIKIGQQTPAELIEFANTSMNPKKRLAYYSDNFEANKNNPDFLYEYAAFGSEISWKENKIATLYLETINEKELFKRRNWNFIWNNNINFFSKPMLYVFKNSTEFEKIYGKDSVQMLLKNGLVSKIKSDIYNVYENNAKGKNFYQGDLRRKKHAAYQSILDFYKNEGIVFSDYLNFHHKLAYASSSNDYHLYSSLILTHGDEFIKSKTELIVVLSEISDNTIEPNIMKKAKELMQKIKLETYQDFKTYASVLYSLGEYSEAKKNAEHALKLAQNEGNDDEWLSDNECINILKMIK